MSLHKIKDFDPDYRQHFDTTDIIGFDLYAANEKVGSVDNIIVDEQGNFRYFVINTGAWILGKKTLLPIGRARIDENAGRVYADSLSRTQIENLPEFDEDALIDYDYEERTRGVYRQNTAAAGTTDLTSPTPNDLASRDTYDYKQDADLYDLNDRDHQSLKLYEERLIANKTRQKTGEVSLGKRVETETAKVSIPIEKERVVIERTAGDATPVAPGEDAFQSGEVARMEIYEETPDIRKEAFVREEVSIRKEVDRETVEAQEQLRREELDVEKEGRTISDRGVEPPATSR
jgi:uncharacterized protein (TIGR02271 family)